MKSPFHNYKNRFLFSNIWKITAVERHWGFFFRPHVLGAYWTAAALDGCLRLAPALSVFALIHLPVGVLLFWLLMTLFPASNDFSEPLMKGLGISAPKHSVPFCSLSPKTQNTKHQTHTRTQHTCLDRIIILYLLLTFPFHVHLRPLHAEPLSSPLPSSRCDTGCRRRRDAQSNVDLGLIFFFPPSFFCIKRKGPHLQRHLHLNTEHKDRSRGIFYFLISLLPACWVCIQTAWAQICMAKGVIMRRSPAALLLDFTDRTDRSWWLSLFFFLVFFALDIIIFCCSTSLCVTLALHKYSYLVNLGSGEGPRP